MTQTADTKQKPRKVRGTATFFEDDSIKFTPYQEAPSTQADVKTCPGGGKRYSTIGADPSKVLHLTCKESSADPYSELASQFVALTKDMRASEPVRMPDKQRVIDEPQMQCWLDKNSQELIFTGTISLGKCYNWQAELMRLMQMMVRTLPVEDHFKKIINKIKKGNTK